MNKRTEPNKVLIASIGLIFIFSAFGTMIAIPGISAASEIINDETSLPIIVPEDYSVELFSEGFDCPSSLAFGSGGIYGDNLFVSDIALSNHEPGSIKRISITGDTAIFIPDVIFPEALVFGPGNAFGSELYFISGADSTSWDDKIMKASPDGTLGVFKDMTTSATNDLSFSPGGDFGELLYMSYFGLLTLDSNATLQQVTTTLDVCSAIEFSDNIEFGDYLYLSVHRRDEIVRMDSAGTWSVFASGINSGPGGMAFGPGDSFGSDLYISDVEHNSIFRISPNGVHSEFASGFDFTIRGGAEFGSIAFDKTGEFGGGLFVADSGSGKIYRIYEDSQEDDALNIPPVAEAGSDYFVDINTAITFDGSGSYDSDGTIVSYAWDFGDGSTGTDISTTHSYSLPGDYTVTLTVTDNDGSIDTDNCSVTVLESPTPANLTIIKEKVAGPDVVETNTLYGWELLITVTNTGGSNASDVIVYDVLPAELTLDNYSLTQGTFTSVQNGGGQMGSMALEWDIGCLSPDESVELSLFISTKTNPAGKQEFTSPGNYSLNDGAWLVGTDTFTGNPIEAGPTQPIMVTAVEIPEPERVEVPIVDNLENIGDNVPQLTLDLDTMTQNLQLNNENLDSGSSQPANGLLAVISVFFIIASLMAVQILGKKIVKREANQKDLDIKLIKGEITEAEYIRQLGIVK